MTNRKFNIACLISTVLMVSTLVLYLAEPVLWRHRVSFRHDFHVSVWRCNIAFFNDVEYGPYHGSVLFLDNDYSDLDRLDHWGPSFGIYYRYFRWRDGVVLWTLMIGLWYPLLLFMILPAVWLRRRIRSSDLQTRS
ncbi:hypothetical protein V144x_54270 [Gimesia aquarii]|uniref:Uncharacterized protein n=1 Tax=Gimesia aquarii TaxID=2527964 RepID=A0A517W3U2_9PLAN|nr:hypothetical protein V144x_54270 [Gimesia aquarii]